MNISAIKSAIASYPDFPKPGVIFRDISPLLANPELWNRVVVDMAGQIWKTGSTHILGLDARGFILGASVAQKLSLPFVMARKPGKLPGVLHSQTYGLEYGSDLMAIQQGALPSGARVAVVDDLLATGGTALATVSLLRMARAIPSFFGFIVEITDLKGRAALRENEVDAPIHTTVQF